MTISSIRASIATFVAATVIAGTVSLAGPAEQVAVGASCVNGWQEMSTPASVFISTPFDIVERKGQAAWIVGGTNNGVLALRWVNGGWQTAATETRGHRGLNGAVAIGNQRLLGVGYFRPYQGNGDGSMVPASGRIIGNDWRGRSVPRPPGHRATLADVVALPKGRAAAVGSRLQNGRLQAYAVIWNGRKWQRSEPGSGSGAGLLGLDRASNGAVWAVGWKESSLGTPRPFAARLRGSQWTRYPIRGVAAGNAVLTDVDFRRGSDGYAVGYVAARGADAYRVFLQHWDGSSWKRVALPWASEFEGLPRSVSLGRDGTVWIAGTKTATDGREPRGFVAHGKDGVWRVDTLDTTDDLRSEVMAVLATDDGAVAAANVGASLLVLQACGENTGRVAAAAAKTGKKVTRRKLKVSQMQRRRASQALDFEFEHEYHDPAGIALDTPATRGVGLAADGRVRVATIAGTPIYHKAFRVVNMAKQSGLKSWTPTYGGLTADFDGNRAPDVFYSRHGGIMPRLAVNAGGTFSSAPTGAFGSVDRHGCAAGDLDADGNQDILCAVGASRGKAVKRHELSLAPGTTGRALVRGALGISDPFGRGRVAAVFKLNKDKYPEVFIGNAPDRDDGFPGYNRFYRNVKGRMVPAPGMGLDTSHGATCAVAGDVDQDGDEDLVYCTQYGFGGRPPGIRFMRNEGGRLKDRTKALRISPIGDIDVAFADVTGDGRKDLIQLAPRRLRVSKWTPRGYRTIYEAALTDGWAVAAGDASGDKRADIFIVRGNDRKNKPDRLLVSKRKGKAFVSVKIPNTSRGTADDVITLDYDRNGLADFVVLNGRGRQGPVQLLASFRR